MSQLPDDSSHSILVGKNGSGKTQALAWQLAYRSWDAMPWIVLNTKNDRLLNRIGAVELEPSANIPREPGLYMMRPLPHDDVQNEILMRAWSQENTGVVIDELYNLPKNQLPLRIVLSQGRSKYCPLIMCVQRPVHVDLAVWSECNYAQVFKLTTEEDRDTIERRVNPRGRAHPLPWQDVIRYHSMWIDQTCDSVTIMRPVPSETEILSTYRARMDTLPQAQEHTHRWL
jgi:hypothetical protein